MIMTSKMFKTLSEWNGALHGAGKCSNVAAWSFSGLVSGFSSLLQLLQSISYLATILFVSICFFSQRALASLSRLMRNFRSRLWVRCQPAYQASSCLSLASKWVATGWYVSGMISKGAVPPAHRAMASLSSGCRRFWATSCFGKFWVC